MTNKSFEQLNQKLINKGIVFEPHPTDEYETSCHLDSIYSWGFIVISNCAVLDPLYLLYDNEYQKICVLDYVDDDFKITDGYLSCIRTLFDTKTRFTYNLNQGAPVHIRDIAAIGYVPNDNPYPDKRFYALNDGRIYYKEDGEVLKQLSDVTIDELIRRGFTLIEPEHYENNVSILNDMIVTR